MINRAVVPRVKSGMTAQLFKSAASGTRVYFDCGRDVRSGTLLVSRSAKISTTEMRLELLN